jgi:hypothetical protein
LGNSRADSKSAGGRAAQLKESVFAVAALGHAAGFDPKIDPIARVEVAQAGL